VEYHGIGLHQWNGNHPINASDFPCKLHEESDEKYLDGGREDYGEWFC
jgi:hypothetical protein